MWQEPVAAFLAVPDLLTGELGARQRAIRALAEVVDESFGDDAEALAVALRAGDGVERLVGLLDDPQPGIYHRAMMVLGNLVGEFFDRLAVESLRLVTRRLLRLLGVDDRPFDLRREAGEETAVSRDTAQEGVRARPAHHGHELPAQPPSLCRRCRALAFTGPGAVCTGGNGGEELEAQLLVASHE